MNAIEYISISGHEYRVDYTGGVEVRVARPATIMRDATVAWRSLAREGKIAAKVRAALETLRASTAGISPA